MKTLAEFLARHIVDRQDYFGTNAEKEYEEMIKWFRKNIAEGIKEYKKQLQNDSPKTVQWATLKKDLITALECTQCQDNLKGARHNSQNMKDIAYPICPLNMYFEGDEDKCDTNKCDFNTETRSCSENCKDTFRMDNRRDPYDVQPYKPS